MNSFAFVVFAVVLAVANAGVVLQGPGTRSAVVGPDGNTIVAAAPGGSISTSVDVGYAAHGIAPAVVATGYAAPVLAHHAPVVAHHGIFPAAPAVVAARGLIAPYGVYPEGSGLRGQYFHDYTETLYDDGSYKGEIYP